MSQTSTPSTLHCSRCGDALPAGFKPGLCPVCLMDVAMHPTHDDTLPVAPPQAPLTPAELAPHFPQLEILEHVGRGGMGVVYKARQKALDRLVALKLLAPGQTKDAAFAARFAHEARALAALNHPNIVTVHDFGESGGFFYLLMEYVDGVNLRQAMRGSRLTPEQALAIVPPICEALQYAHEQGIVHRDIKPENLLLDKAGKVKIADFGIAKMLSRPTDAAAAGQAAASAHGTMMAGTPEYMAPEQRRTAPQTDHRADIYSLGVVLYELLTGELPKGSLKMSRHGAVTDARLDEIVRRALEQDPEQRYQTVKELQTHLATLTAAPAEVIVYPRAAWQGAFCWLLRAGGVACASYGVWRLLKPETLNRPAVVPFWLEVPVLFFAAAWILIVHAGWLTRISYRTLLMPPRLLTEGGGMVLRVAGLLGIGKAVAGLRLHWIFGSMGGLEFGVILLFFSIGLFRFEHAFAPMAYAIPGWRPLPYANTSTRRRPSGHALVSAIPLVFLLVMLPLTVALFSRRLTYETGMEWSGDMLRGLAFWGCLAAIASMLGWAAVNLIRGSQGRLFGLGLASASALTLPLYLGFLILTFLIFSVAARLSVSFITLADGSVREDFSRHPDLLRGTAIAAGLACLVAWLWVWKKIRALPRPSTAAARPRPRTAFAMGGGLAFAALVVAMYSLMTSKLPPSPKIRERAAAGMSMRQGSGAHAQPGNSSLKVSNAAAPLPPYEPRFARHVERQLNLRLFIHGYDHTLPQGALKLPPDHRLLSVTLPGFRDVDGNRRVKGVFELSRAEESVLVRGEKAMEDLRFTVSQRTPEAVPQEVVLPVPQAGTRCLCSLRSNFLIEPPAALHERLQTTPENLSREDIAWLEENRADLMVQMEADGSVALRFLGGSAVPVPHSFPADFDWLKLDDRELARALVKAYASIPAAGGSTLARMQSPAVLAFTTRKACGLIENRGPSKPGARDARLRISRFSFNPFR